MLNLFSKTQFFIAFCALLMGAETYYLAGITADYLVLATIFFATLFIYNASRVKIAVSENDSGRNHTISLTGDESHIIFCGISLVLVFAGLAASHFFNIIIFIVTAVLSVFYMMPFTRNGHPVKGLRNHLWLKNIVLSLIWASATVLFPVAGETAKPEIPAIAFIFVRRFFFIYALTVVYDIRDMETDRKAGMKTLAARYGERGARGIALLLLAVFVIFIAADPWLRHQDNLALSAALYVSALLTALIILGTGSHRGKNYYSYVIDGAMMIQFALILLFTAHIH